MTKEDKKKLDNARRTIAYLKEVGADPVTVATLEMHVATAEAVDMLEQQIDRLTENQAAMNQHLMRVARRVDCV